MRQTALYRAAKRFQPIYLRCLALQAEAFRAFSATFGIERLVHNPVQMSVATDIARNRNTSASAGLSATSIQPDRGADRQLPADLPERAIPIFDKVRQAHSGDGVLYRLQDGRAWGAEGAVVSRDRRLLGDLSPVIRVAPNAHRVFRRPRFTAPKRIDGSVALVTGPSPNNLSHWMFGILPRLALVVEADPDLAHVDWVAVPRLTTTFHAESLRRLGLPGEKIFEVDASSFIEARELIAASFVSAAYVAPRWFLDRLRRGFEDVPAASHRRVYLSRRNAKGRRIRNEKELIHRLSAFGFQSVRLEERSFLDQVGIFKGADIIVAPHGAGLSHVAFCRQDAALVELFSPAYINAMYWCLADEVGLRYRCCLGSATGAPQTNDLVRDDITVNVGEVVDTVKAFLAA